MRLSSRSLVKPPPAVRASSFLRPGWLVTHVVLLGAAVAMVFLGLWQLRVSESNHFAFQNTSYVVQWWLFSACAVAFWLRLIRDARRPPDSAPSTGGEIVRAAGQTGALALTGPANLLRVDSTGTTPIAYRGYVLPDSNRTPHRSYGDDYHNSYNDYLWELALIDGADAAAVPTDDAFRPGGPPTGDGPTAVSGDRPYLDADLDTDGDLDSDGDRGTGTHRTREIGPAD